MVETMDILKKLKEQNAALQQELQKEEQDFLSEYGEDIRYLMEVAREAEKAGFRIERTGYDKSACFGPRPVGFIFDKDGYRITGEGITCEEDIFTDGTRIWYGKDMLFKKKLESIENLEEYIWGFRNRFLRWVENQLDQEK